MIVSTSVGFISWPPLATAADTIAICSGDTRSLAWPNDDSMSSASLAIGG